MVPAVVGCRKGQYGVHGQWDCLVRTVQVMVKGLPTGTISVELGCEMEFPLGLLPPGTVMAETRLAKAAVSAMMENCILDRLLYEYAFEAARVI